MGDHREESTGYGIIQLQIDQIKQRLEQQEKINEKNEKKFERQEEINQTVKSEIREVVTAYGRVELILANLKETTDEVKSDVKNITKNLKDEMKEVTKEMKTELMKEIDDIDSKAGKDQEWRGTLETILRVVITLIAGFGFGKFL